MKIETALVPSSPSAPTNASLNGEASGSITPIAIGIASAGRPAILRQTVEYIQRLSQPAPRIIVCVPTLDDASGLDTDTGIELIIGSRGLTTQRNRILRSAITGSQIVVFLDDDFLPAPEFLPVIATTFAAQPDIAIATGHVLADGILTGGLELAEALDILAVSRAPSDRITEVYNAYGCNMAVRLAPVIDHNVTFDERLPLYGWLEDVDFSRNIARYGRSVQIWGARGVHLGVKSGRQSGLKLGYSQVANPVHLMRKRTMSAPRALSQIGRNLLANGRGFLLHDAAIDRRGRLLGNIRAIADLLKGNLSPSRILEFEQPSQDTPLSSAAARRR